MMLISEAFHITTMRESRTSVIKMIGDDERTNKGRQQFKCGGKNIPESVNQKVPEELLLT
jgi:hypothetical protein